MIETLIDKLLDNKINIEWIAPANLKIYAQINELPAELLAEIKENKEQLINYLKANQQTHEYQRIPAGRSIPFLPHRKDYGC